MSVFCIEDFDEIVLDIINVLRAKELPAKIEFSPKQLQEVLNRTLLRRDAIWHFTKSLKRLGAKVENNDKEGWNIYWNKESEAIYKEKKDAIVYSVKRIAYQTAFYIKTAYNESKKPVTLCIDKEYLKNKFKRKTFKGWLFNPFMETLEEKGIQVDVPFTSSKDSICYLKYDPDNDIHKHFSSPEKLFESVEYQVYEPPYILTEGV